MNDSEAKLQEMMRGIKKSLGKHLIETKKDKGGKSWNAYGRTNVKDNDWDCSTAAKTENQAIINLYNNLLMKEVIKK